jgi:uncharacterized membrane protein YkgB
MKRLANLRVYMGLSLVAALFVGVLVLFGSDNWGATVIGFLVTFIVSIVTIATLDLSFKPDQGDPNRPRLR